MFGAGIDENVGSFYQLLHLQQETLCGLLSWMRFVLHDMAQITMMLCLNQHYGCWWYDAGWHQGICNHHDDIDWSVHTSGSPTS